MQWLRNTAHFFRAGGRIGADAFEDASAPRPIDSDSVGCGWIVRPMSTASRAHLDRERDLADQVARVRADDAAADDPVRRVVEQELREAFVAAVGDRASGRRPREERPCSTLMPFAFASSSVTPAQAISGSV